MTICPYFDNPKFDIFDVVVLTACLSRVYYVPAVCPASTDASVQNWFIVFLLLPVDPLARNWFLSLFHWHCTSMVAHLRCAKILLC